MLTFPLSVLGILGLWVVAGLLRRYGDRRLAVRALYFALALMFCYALGVAAVTIIGGAIALLGAHANPVFVAARYLWLALTVLGLALGHVYGSRAVESEPTVRSIERRDVFPLGALTAGVALILYVPYLFVDSTPHLWALPYQGVELLFDLATPQLSSDECLAFRTVDDVQVAFGSPPPGAMAFQTLDHHGIDAVPGISAFLRDQLSRGWPDSPSTVGLLATVAGYGDFPICTPSLPQPNIEQISCWTASTKVVTFAAPPAQATAASQAYRRRPGLATPSSTATCGYVSRAPRRLSRGGCRISPTNLGFFYSTIGEVFVGLLSFLRKDCPARLNPPAYTDFLTGS